MKISREFYQKDGIAVARGLLGKILVHHTPEGVTKGKIVETEAYMGLTDKASHSYRGPKQGRTSIQYGPGGFAYIYFIYGMHTCMNVVANGPETPEAVLIRALEPVFGIELMKSRRNTGQVGQLCSGPGKLCQAMAITREDYGADLCGDVLYVEDAPPLPETDILASPRINIDYAEEAREFLWRFTIRDNPFVSK